MKSREVYNLLIRYLLLLVLALPNLALFYFILTPLTVYPVFVILSLFFKSNLLEGNVIFFQGNYIELIPACIAGAAYYFLAILNLTTSMKIDKRIKSLSFLFTSFLVINIVRILLFSLLLLSGYQYFDITHKLAWYFGSTALVVFVWFTNVLLFKIKEIPVYTDIKNLLRDINKKKYKH